MSTPFFPCAGARALYAKSRPAAARPNGGFFTWFILTAARSPTLREAAIVARRVLAKRLHSRPKKSSFWPDIFDRRPCRRESCAGEEALRSAQP